MRSPPIFFAALSTLLFAAAPAAAATLSVGPGKPYAKPCDAIAAAMAGDTIEVDAAGSYDGDTCAWMTDNLTVRGINGRAKIDATNTAVTQKKGIFVVYADNATIENFELSGAAISAGDGNNGAGIRHQGLNLTVRGCYFHDNQDGILSGPPAAGMGEILIESSEFYKNGAGDGYSHNMYIGNSAKFTLRGSYSHGALVGHLVKTRANENYILYNRITGEDGTDSYEIDVPQGGKTYIVGNLIQQSAATQNPAIITYTEEGPKNPSLDLFVINNSIVNDLGKGTFVHVDGSAMPAVIKNNIFVGQGTPVDQASAVQAGNFTGDPKFLNMAGFDYHLTAGSPCVDMGMDPGMGDGYPLAPDHQYVHPANLEGRVAVGAIDIGAYELGGGSSTGAGGGAGATTGATGATTGAGTGATAATGATTGAGGAGATSGAGGSGGDGGGSTSGGGKGACSCGVPGAPAGTPAAALLALAAGVALARRRRDRA